MSLNQTPVEQFIETIKISASEVGASLTPNGDWPPVLFLDTLQGKEIDLIDNLTTDNKPAIAAFIAKRITETHAYLAAFLTTGWMSLYAPDAAGRAAYEKDTKRYGFGNIKDRPNKIGVVNVFIVSPSQATLIYAPITRHPRNAPQLGTWTQTDTNVNAGGLFPTAMRDALLGVNV